jgi:hypothetical protein
MKPAKPKAPTTLVKITWVFGIDSKDLTNDPILFAVCVHQVIK